MLKGLIKKNTALISNKMSFCKMHARKTQYKPIFHVGDP